MADSDAYLLCFAVGALFGAVTAGMFVRSIWKHAYCILFRRASCIIELLQQIIHDTPDPPVAEPTPVEPEDDYHLADWWKRGERPLGGPL